MALHLPLHVAHLRHGCAQVDLHHRALLVLHQLLALGRVVLALLPANFPATLVQTDLCEVQPSAGTRGDSVSSPLETTACVPQLDRARLLRELQARSTGQLLLTLCRFTSFPLLTSLPVLPEASMTSMLRPTAERPKAYSTQSSTQHTATLLGH